MQTSFEPFLGAQNALNVDAFAQREPCRYMVIDDFFSARYAPQLLAKFSAFERGNARNAVGEARLRYFAQVAREQLRGLMSR